MPNGTNRGTRTVALMHVAEHRSAGCWCVAAEKGKNPLVQVKPADEAKSVWAGFLTIGAPNEAPFQAPVHLRGGGPIGDQNHLNHASRDAICMI